MKIISDVLTAIDNVIWGPAMLVLLVGTSIFLTIRTRFLCLRNLPYALKCLVSKESRQTAGDGDVSPFSALATSLAATIGTGNIVGVATAMVSGGPGALIWMWISAFFGLTSKFSECMLAIKYREINKKGEMSGGPMYTMKKGFKHKKTGTVFGWLFALFTVIASFGIGNLTQANSVATAVKSTFNVPEWLSGLVITVLAMLIILGGIKSISKVSQVVVPLMAAFYILGGIIVIIGNITKLPAGLAMIFKMAFSLKAVGGGLCGSLTASLAQAMRYGVARGVFSNEAGMGSAAITAAAASTTDPVRQGYINMTGTFWDTIVVCTITGLCVASSGVLGMTDTVSTGLYMMPEWSASNPSIIFELTDSDYKTVSTTYDIYDDILTDENVADDKRFLTLISQTDGSYLTLTADLSSSDTSDDYYRVLSGRTWNDTSGNEYVFSDDGTLEYREVVTGAALTIAAFKTILGTPGSRVICIGIVLFAFSSIIGWEYNGEKAFEYLFGTHKYNMIYRTVYSLIVFIGAVTTLQIAWTFSDIANALMIIPNIICLLVMSNVIVKEINRYQNVLKEEKANRK